MNLKLWGGTHKMGHVPNSGGSPSFQYFNISNLILSWYVIMFSGTSIKVCKGLQLNLYKLGTNSEGGE